MKLETAIHSFLAARYPAAFDSRTIKERVGRSGAVDGEISEAETINALCLLARRFGYVELETGARLGGVKDHVMVKPVKGTAELEPVIDRILTDFYSRAALPLTRQGVPDFE